MSAYGSAGSVDKSVVIRGTYTGSTMVQLSDDFPVTASTASINTHFTSDSSALLNSAYPPPMTRSQSMRSLRSGMPAAIAFIPPSSSERIQWAKGGSFHRNVISQPPNSGKHHIQFKQDVVDKVVPADSTSADQEPKHVHNFLVVAVISLLMNPILGVVALALSVSSIFKERKGNYRAAKWEGIFALIAALLGICSSLVIILLIVLKTQTNVMCSECSQA